MMSAGLLSLSLLALGLFVSCDQEEPGDRTQPSVAASFSSSPNGDGVASCPPANDPVLPPDAGCVSTVTSDDATLNVYATTDAAGQPQRWFARVDGADDAEYSFGKLLDYPRAVGASDVDLDGDEDWWIKVGDYASHGAAWAYLNLFVVEDDKLVPLKWNGTTMPIGYGGISRLGEGAECREGFLVLLRAEAQDLHNTRWKLIERKFSIDGHNAKLVDRDERFITTQDYLDPRVRRYFQVACQGDVFEPF